jgi:hypothetical protein
MPRALSRSIILTIETKIAFTRLPDPHSGQ